MFWLAFWLATTASIFTIIGTLWLILFGGKAVHEIVPKLHAQKMRVLIKPILTAVKDIILALIPLVLIIYISLIYLISNLFFPIHQRHNKLTTPFPTPSPIASPVLTFSHINPPKSNFGSALASDKDPSNEKIPSSNLTSNFGPALAVLPTQDNKQLLFLAWTGTDSRLNIALYSPTSKSLIFSHPLSAKSSSNPALAVLGNQLFLAWTGTDTHGQLNIALYNSNDRKHGDLEYSYVLKATSNFGPALAVLPTQDNKQKLFLAWTGKETKSRLNVANCDPMTGKLTDQSTLKATSSSSPALAVLNDSILGEQLYISWTDIDHGLNIVPYYPQNPLPPHYPLTSSSSNPALAVISAQDNKQQLFLAWAGTDKKRSLNVNPR